jgi:hypothetical protein
MSQTCSNGLEIVVSQAARGGKSASQKVVSQQNTSGSGGRC